MVRFHPVTQKVIGMRIYIRWGWGAKTTQEPSARPSRHEDRWTKDAERLASDALRFHIREIGADIQVLEDKRRVYLAELDKRGVKP